MNKKGALVGLIGGTFSLLIIVLIMVNLMAIDEGVVEKEEVYESLNWSRYNKNLTVSEEKGPIVNVIFSFVNAFGYSAMEMAKLGIEWGTTNLKLRPITIMKLILIAIFAPIVLVLIKLILITTIFIRDIIAARREKKELDRLRRKK